VTQGYKLPFAFLGSRVTNNDEGLLSSVLRRRLLPEHRALERSSGLPDRIVTRDDYIAYLRMYYGLFINLEMALDIFPMSEGGFAFVPVRRAPLLRRDLQVLGAFRSLPRITRPTLSSFAQALGVRYVMEGSALGGQVILAALEPRLGPQIDGATNFFSGLGRGTMAHWRDFKTALDAYGAAHPAAHDTVVQGGSLCFGMFAEALRHQALGVPA